ncbi:lytic murein transglycosylase [Micromonospora sp. NPDC049114]|uniref:lytic transglycosylase domain-containing protein n=1 Tax=Micromonospora sp. NPDC049114 TaxID=3155498 RepID=UPI0033F64F33
MSDTRRVVDGEDKTRVQPLRPAAPLDGPLAESGAAPDPAPAAVPRPRRPWLRGGTTDAKAKTPATSVTTDAPLSPNVDTPTGDQLGATATGDLAPAKPSSDTTDPDAPTAAAAGSAEAGRAGAEADDAKAESPTRDDAEGDTAKADSIGAPKTDNPRADTAEAESAKVDGAKTDTAKTDDAKTDTAKTDGAKVDTATAAGATATDVTATKVDGVAVVPVPERGRRRRVPFAHAVRVPPPRQAAVTAARATRAWARRPSGRLTVPGVFLLVLVAATAAAGALLVPATIRGSRPVADVTAAPTVALPPAVPLDPLPTGPLPTGPMPTAPLPTGAFPSGGMPTGPAVGPTAGGRPSDSLAAWAQQVAAKVNIPATAVQAYGYAEVMLAQTNRSCALSWTTLAAIGQVESGHGSANGARLGADGKALPQIIGLPLDGNGGRMRIIDTDRGVLDKDSTFDRAIGPMQFIPTTWQEIGADADQDGVKDPHDLDDAALAAGNYLCKGGRNLSIPGDWWNAILSYNDVRQYAKAVYDTADRYGRASRT